MGRRSIPPHMSRPITVDLGGQLRHFFDALAAAAEGLAKTGSGEIPLSSGSDSSRAVFGYTVRVGLDGLKAERFGDVPPGRRSAAAAATTPAARAPIIDLFEEGDTVRIVAELPGVDSADVVCAVDDETLSIQTNGVHVYRKTVQLPHKVIASSLTKSCRNGILEVCLRRAAAS